MVNTHPANRCDSGYQTLSEVTLDMIFLRVAHAPVRHHLPIVSRCLPSIVAYTDCSFASREGSFCCKVLGTITCCTDLMLCDGRIFPAFIVQSSRMVRR